MVTNDRADPGNVLFGRTRRRLLGWLFGHPAETFYLRELLRLTGTPAGAAQRELAALTQAGILRRTVEGRQVYFQADRDSPIFAELQSLLLKTAGVVPVLRGALGPIADRIQLAFLFGSAARHELRRESDIDLAVVGDVSFGEVVDTLADAQQILGREINPTVYPDEEFRRKVLAGHHFLTSVLKAPMIFVIGGPDELERLGAEEPMAGRPSDGEGRDRQSAPDRRTGPAGQPRRRSQR